MMRKAAFAILLIMGYGTLAEAQNLGIGQLQETRSNVAAYYFYARPGDLTMVVNVWGTVRYPGQYETRLGTDLGQLLSLAGGPQLTPRQQRDKREITLRLSRKYEDGRRVIYEASLDSMVVSPAQYPILQEGDVLTVETVERRGFSWRDVFPVVSAIAAVALAVERFASTR